MPRSSRQGRAVSALTSSEVTPSTSNQYTGNCLSLDACVKPQCDCMPDEACAFTEGSCWECPIAECTPEVAPSRQAPPLAVIVAPVILVSVLAAVAGIIVYLRRRRQRAIEARIWPIRFRKGDEQSDKTAVLSAVLQMRLDKLKSMAPSVSEARFRQQALSSPSGIAESDASSTLYEELRQAPDPKHMQ